MSSYSENGILTNITTYMSCYHIGAWVRLSVSGTMSTIAGMYFMRTAGQDIPPSGKDLQFTYL